MACKSLEKRLKKYKTPKVKKPSVNKLSRKLKKKY